MFIELILLTAALLGIAILIMGIKVFFKKGAKFPETSIGKNKEMKKLGLKCAKHEEIHCRRVIDGSTTSDTGGCGCG